VVARKLEFAKEKPEQKIFVSPAKSVTKKLASNLTHSMQILPLGSLLDGLWWKLKRQDAIGT